MLKQVQKHDIFHFSPFTTQSLMGEGVGEEENVDEAISHRREWSSGCEGSGQD